MCRKGVWDEVPIIYFSGCSGIPDPRVIMQEGGMDDVQ